MLKEIFPHGEFEHPINEEYYIQCDKRLGVKYIDTLTPKVKYKCIVTDVKKFCVARLKYEI